ncbi:FtsB family cell division protein [Acidicapsa acidisoli]|uniref:FtsB family cell division protein n=1 Tax=Acidicapsa acidisoli TaxID=1615681 RepID=UPI0021E0AC7C|nr:septum formation initiator family protein [Acidicapsa acidisoli]
MPETSQPAPSGQTPAKSLTQRWWSEYLSNRRRIGTVAAVLFALFLAWHVVNGRNGITSWQQKRVEDKALAKEIEELTAENARLSQHVDRLKSDPGAIEHEARERLHYARPNEIIYALPETSPPQKTNPQH